MAEKAFYATGRRKTSNARVYLYPVKNSESETVDITVNEKSYIDYFGRETAQMIIVQPIKVAERTNAYRIIATVSGGGLSGQAGALRHGISRALIAAETDLRPALKKEGFLTRDPRSVERKKPGRHKARRKPQFSKR